MRKIDYYELGATLYIPALNRNLNSILRREKYPFLKSIVICLEDSISCEDFQRGVQTLKESLEKFKKSDLKVFIRARNSKNLRDILNFKNIELIDGFALAKFGIESKSEYLEIFREFKNFYIMPILETKDVFSTEKLIHLREELKEFKERILTVRIGGEDILSNLNMVRNCDRVVYEIMPIYLIISKIINIFKPEGFNISSVVYACFRDSSLTLKREVELDKEHQMFNKTSIHPKQIESIQNSYRVSKDEYYVANKLLNSNLAIFKHRDRMYERKTHLNWAETIFKRYKNFGLEESLG